MKSIVRLALLAGLGLLTACGVPLSAEKIATVKPNETKYDEVVALFGLPTSEVSISGGSKIALYHRQQYTRSGEQYLPYYNLFQTEYDYSAYDFFIFNREGVLQSYSIPYHARRAGIANPGS